MAERMTSLLVPVALHARVKALAQFEGREIRIITQRLLLDALSRTREPSQNVSEATAYLESEGDWI